MKILRNINPGYMDITCREFKDVDISSMKQLLFKNLSEYEKSVFYRVSCFDTPNAYSMLAENFFKNFCPTKAVEVFDENNTRRYFLTAEKNGIETILYSWKEVDCVSMVTILIRLKKENLFQKLNFNPKRYRVNYDYLCIHYEGSFVCLERENIQTTRKIVIEPVIQMVNFFA